MKDIVQIIFPINSKTGNLSEATLVSGMVTGLKKLIEIGALSGPIDEILLNYYVNDKVGIVADIPRSSLIDASKLNTLNSSLSYNIDWDRIDDDFKLDDKKFSASSIQERLRISNLDPKLRFRYIILDYKKYYNSNKSKLEKRPDDVKKLKDMFLIDVMGLFTQLMPALQEGKQLSQLTGLNNVSDGLLTISKDLSLAYKRALKQAKEGQISKTNFQMLQKKYSEFMNLLIPQVFPGIDKIYMTQKSYSNKEDFEWIKASTNCSDKLLKILTAIKDKASVGHSFDVIIDPNHDPVKINIDGDGSDRINYIDSGKLSYNTTKIINPNKLSSKTSVISKVKHSEYSYTEDGRIKLFSS